MAHATDDTALDARLERIKRLTDELARTQADSAKARQLASASSVKSMLRVIPPELRDELNENQLICRARPDW